MLKALVSTATDLEAHTTTDDTPLHKAGYTEQSARKSAVAGQRGPPGAKSKGLYGLWPKQSSHLQTKRAEYCSKYEQRRWDIL